MMISDLRFRLLAYLPDYPSFDDREAFYNDSLLYRRGAAMRETEHCHLTYSDISDIVVLTRLWAYELL